MRISLVVVSLVAGTWAMGCGGASDDVMDGYWEGEFMPGTGMNLTLVLHFTTGTDSSQVGRILLWDGSNQIQDDALADIEVGEGGLSFRIPAKQTQFQGHVSADGEQIGGSFVFPDGSRHTVDATRVATPTRVMQLPSSLAGLEEPVWELPRDDAVRDVRFLMSVIADNHPAPYRFVTRDSLEHMAKSLETGLPEIVTTDELARHLRPLVAAIGCVHTVLRPPAELAQSLRSQPGYLPVGIALREGSAYLTESMRSPPVKAGSEVVSINGIPIDSALATMRRSISADGRSAAYRDHVIGDDFARTYADAFGRRDAFDIEVRGPGGILHRLQLAGEPLRTRRSEEREPVLRWVQDGQVAYLRIPSFAPADVGSAEDSLGAFFREMNSAGAVGLVVDVRGNKGGHPQLAVRLLSHLVNEPFRYFEGDAIGSGDLERLYEEQRPAPNRFRGRVAVIMDGGGVSTTGHFLSIVRTLELGLLVGSESGSTYWSNDQTRRFVLPASRVEVSVPGRTFQTRSGGLAQHRGIRPDVPVDTTPLDAIDGRDRALEMAIASVLDAG